MGQRLNIEFYVDGKCLVNCYYHWSAYTETALDMTKEILQLMNIKPFQKLNDIKLNKMYFVNLLRFTGSCLVIQNTDDMFTENHIDYGTYRDFGLIGVTEKDMQRTRAWQEGIVIFDMDNKTINFGVFYTVKVTNLIEDYTDEQIQNIKSIQNKGIKFEDFNNFYNTIKEHGEGNLLKCNEEYFSWIY